MRLFDAGATRRRRAAESSELTGAQFDAFSRQVPLLYFILLINTGAVAYTHLDDSPRWLSVYVPGVLGSIGLTRILVWLRRRGRHRHLTDGEIRQRLSAASWITAIFGISFTTWAFALYPYGDADAHVQIAFSTAITVIGCIFCLMHLRRAALLLTVIMVVPFTIFFVRTQNSILMTIALNMVFVTIAIIVMMLVHYRDFANLIESRKTLQDLSDANLRLAKLDTLTGLTNRRSFLEQLEGLCREMAGGCRTFAVGVIDLDGFKQVNDLHGHQTGDQVLEEVGKRLMRLQSAECTFARLGGDEFGLLVRNENQIESLLTLGGKISRVLKEPYRCAGANIRLSASLGIAQFPVAATTPHQLFERADHALYQAKEHRRGGTTIFSGEIESAIRRASMIEQLLREADLDREMTLHYQPIIDVTNRRVVSFEALARWRSSILGDVPPSEFIPVAERSDLVHAITLMLLGKVLGALQMAEPCVRVSFNLSARDLNSPDTILAIIDMIRRSAVSPARLTIEITETAVIRDFNQARHALSELKQFGVHLSLDDFGTGFSSLHCIHRLPLDKVKIDRSFVREIDFDAGAQNIVRSIVSMCRSLRLTCVVEGVETEAQSTVLRKLGCNVMQGYLFGRPAPVLNDPINAWSWRGDEANSGDMAGELHR
ncbi:EAL domain-containing protein [Paraburkholderia sp. 1N]|uniref:EAL domain-containing protein n=1 Tax=Paraburkholderia solitsugae TaxID=2675748 RepID=A0ABX2C6D6_9BURK|nr:EAL domain-containing protein [Paraburkholderia solitsugae]NPT48001.1 EAL domain-containing protein [Paraburkholderia solitsugae]